MDEHARVDTQVEAALSLLVADTLPEAPAKQSFFAPALLRRAGRQAVKLCAAAAEIAEDDRQEALDESLFFRG